MIWRWWKASATGSRSCTLESWRSWGRAKRSSPPPAITTRGCCWNPRRWRAGRFVAGRQRAASCRILMIRLRAAPLRRAARPQMRCAGAASRRWRPRSSRCIWRPATIRLMSPRRQLMSDPLERGAGPRSRAAEARDAETQRPRSRADAIAAAIRDLISTRGLKPGDRLPAEWLSETSLKASKGTLREAMKALQTQGLIRTRRGPGGGVFVAALSGEQAKNLLSNLFLFERPSIADIYSVRKLLEPELAAGLAGQLDATAFEELRSTIRLYEKEPKDAEEEFQQRPSELDFHSLLAGFSENRILAFVCVFLHRLLRDMAVCRAIYLTPNPTLRETALNYQVQLLRLLDAGDAEGARVLMRRHMEEAERYMLERAAIRQPQESEVIRP